MRQPCILAVMKANCMLCCINRSAVSRLAKRVILLCLALVRRYVVPCLQFCHPSTRDMTCRQARGGPVAWLGACSTWSKAEGTHFFQPGEGKAKCEDYLQSSTTHRAVTEKAKPGSSWRCNGHKFQEEKKNITIRVVSIRTGAQRGCGSSILRDFQTFTGPVSSGGKMI